MSVLAPFTQRSRPTAPPPPAATPPRGPSPHEVLAIPVPSTLDASCTASVTIESFFQADHQITVGHHRGDRHTHTFRLQVTCTGKPGDTNGVLVAFHALREKVDTLSRAYMHQFLNDLPPFTTSQPTTERLTVVLFHQLDTLLRELPIMLTEVTLWESPTQAASIQRK